MSAQAAAVHKAESYWWWHDRLDLPLSRIDRRRVELWAGGHALLEGCPRRLGRAGVDPTLAFARRRYIDAGYRPPCRCVWAVWSAGLAGDFSSPGGIAVRQIPALVYRRSRAGGVPAVGRPTRAGPGLSV